jgi:hypothetical protein
MMGVCGLAQFLLQEGDLGLRLLEVCRQTGVRVNASSGARPRVDTGQPRQGDDVEQGGLDVAAPVIGEKQVRTTVVLGQINLEPIALFASPRRCRG